MNSAPTPITPQLSVSTSAAAAFSALFVLVVSLACSSPALGPLDAGDLATASMTLGVPHATGYPLEVMLGRVFAWIPLGNAAARIAWTSALASALAAYFAVELARRAVVRGSAWPVAAAVAAVFVTAPTLALHARIPAIAVMDRGG